MNIWIWILYGVLDSINFSWHTEVHLIILSHHPGVVRKEYLRHRIDGWVFIFYVHLWGDKNVQDVVGDHKRNKMNCGCLAFKDTRQRPRHLLQWAVQSHVIHCCGGGKLPKKGERRSELALSSWIDLGWPEKENKHFRKGEMRNKSI